MSFPSFRYGPQGQSKIFHAEADVPKGWEDHPSKVVDADFGHDVAPPTSNETVHTVTGAVFDDGKPLVDPVHDNGTQNDDDVLRKQDGSPAGPDDELPGPAPVLREDGPTLAEYVAAGYPPDTYPPDGYAVKAPDPKADRALIIAALNDRKVVFAKNTPTARLYEVLVNHILPPAVQATVTEQTEA